MKSRGAPGNISGQNYTGDPKPPSVLVSRALKSHPLGSRIKLLIKRSFPVEGRGGDGRLHLVMMQSGYQRKKGHEATKVSKATKVRHNLQGVLPSQKKRLLKETHRPGHMV